MRKQLYLLLAILGLNACQLMGPKVEEVAVHGDLHTLRFGPTPVAKGSLDTLDDSHVSKIKEKASEICKGKKYDIVEHGAKPSTMLDKTNLDPRDHYFVIRCNLRK